jgi:hypothetical protein
MGLTIEIRRLHLSGGKAMAHNSGAEFDAHHLFWVISLTLHLDKSSGEKSTNIWPALFEVYVRFRHPSNSRE